MSLPLTVRETPDTVLDALFKSCRTDSDVHVAASLAQRRYNSLAGASASSGLALALLLVSLVVGGGFTLVNWLIAASFALGSAMLGLTFAGAALRQRIRLLESLQGHDCCTDAFSLTMRNKAARRVRDEVLALGRHLYVFDYVRMLRAAEAEDIAVHHRERDDAWRALHNPAA